MPREGVQERPPLGGRDKGLQEDSTAYRLCSAIGELGLALGFPVPGCPYLYSGGGAAPLGGGGGRLLGSQEQGPLQELGRHTPT